MAALLSRIRGGFTLRIAAAVVLVLAGLSAFPVAGVLFGHATKSQGKVGTLRADGVHAEGTLVGSEPGNLLGIRFSTGGGRILILWFPAPTPADRLADGKIDIVYNPKNPYEAALAHQVGTSAHAGAGDVVSSGIVAVAGLGLIALGVALVTGLRKGGREPAGR